jgi:hypothetical protein
MIKNDIGFIIPNLYNDDQSNALCEIISSLISQNKKYQFCIFNQYNELIDTKNVPLMPVSHSRYFPGDLVILDFPSLVMAGNFPTTKNIYYFTNSMPWSTSFNSYESWKKIFCNDKLKVFTNSDDITSIYNMLWNIKAQTIQEINYVTISSIL